MFKSGGFFDRAGDWFSSAAGWVGDAAEWVTDLPNDIIQFGEVTGDVIYGGAGDTAEQIARNRAEFIGRTDLGDLGAWLARPESWAVLALAGVALVVLIKD